MRRAVAVGLWRRHLSWLLGSFAALAGHACARKTSLRVPSWRGSSEVGPSAEGNALLALGSLSHNQSSEDDKPSLDDGPVPPRSAERLQHVINVGGIVEDFETRQKPPSVAIPGQEAQDRLTPQQRKGLSGVFDQSPDDFRDCVLIHQYAEPLEVVDAFGVNEQGGLWAKIYRGDGNEDVGKIARRLEEAEQNQEDVVAELCSMGFPRQKVLLALQAAYNIPDKALEYLLDENTPPAPEGSPSLSDVERTQALPSSTSHGFVRKRLGMGPTVASVESFANLNGVENETGSQDILVRPGAVFDSATNDGSALHIGTKMFAKLEGMSNPIQVIPHGPVAHWSSKERVPIAGFLCLEVNKSDSAPILHSTPTPCVPTTLDVQGNALDPFVDPYEVFIGTTRVTFNSKTEAEEFCYAYATEISRDLATVVWDAEDIENSRPEPQHIEVERLNVGDLCFRFCEDGSQTFMDATDQCPPQAPCASPLPPGTTSYDTCGPRAHTCGGVSPIMQGPAPAPATAADIAPVVVQPPGGGAVAKGAVPSGLAPSPPGTPPTEAVTGFNRVENDGEAEAEAIAADALGMNSSPSADKEEVSLAQTKRRHRRLRNRRHVGPLRRWHRRHHSGPRVAAASLRHRRQHRLRPRRGDGLAESRMRMAAGVHSHISSEDVLTRGLPSLRVLKSPDLFNFIAASRKRATPEGWTMGTKRLLVVVMDWKIGDQSLAPYSQQDPDPLPLYKDKIFPEVQRHFSEMSYGQFALDIEFVPQVVRFTRNRNQIAGSLPFPALYNEAREAVQDSMSGSQILFRDYDLVYVIHPQVNPTGTKGIAWVGARGAACNGCETISDKFKVMVAVHELGHNLGLMHASSEALEYGNPFDWMGNYPDVTGLHYGLGYKSGLNWIADQNILDIADADLENVNDEVILTPFDTTTKPELAQVVGVRISLKANVEDIYLSYRSTLADGRRGLFVVYQAKDTPDSKLMDAGCHSTSQQDAHLREGWTYMDGSHQVVVRVLEEKADYVRVHVYRAPKDAADVASIWARPLFTDGRTKCPWTCQDSDLIISQTCSELKEGGYCSGRMTLQGKTLYIGADICPQTCGNCDELLKRSPEVSDSGCVDSNIKISDMDCLMLAKRDLCEAKTTSGKSIGSDLCRKSCGQCPKAPPSSSTADLQDPKPARVVGGSGSSGKICPAGCRAPSCRPGVVGNGGLPLTMGGGLACMARCSRRFDEVRYCGSGGEYEHEGSLDCSACTEPEADWGSGASLRTSEEEQAPEKEAAPETAPSSCDDDKTWVDSDGHTCESYKNTVSKWGKDKVCKQHLGGVGALYCRATCGTCKAIEEGDSSACADNACIGPWLEAYGRCFQCTDFTRGCQDEVTKEVFRAECPRTCGVCKATADDSKAEEEDDEVDNDDEQKDGKEEDCEDEDSEFCDDLGARFCSEGAFAGRCRRTCNLCRPLDGGSSGTTCFDRFSSFTCARYESYGWCTRKDTRDAVRLQCPVTCGLCDFDGSVRVPGDERNKGGSGSSGRTESAAEKSGAASRMQAQAVILFSMMFLCTWPSLAG
mmetsp:Transcript_6291/g.15472  ORF Transcript_6291/g.15472 Transcript_6291/m.15472 type:complete len:1551 (-) Transcript_6291:161-4813(-)